MDVPLLLGQRIATLGQEPAYLVRRPRNYSFIFVPLNKFHEIAEQKGQDGFVSHVQLFEAICECALHPRFSVQSI